MYENTHQKAMLDGTERDIFVCDGLIEKYPKSARVMPIESLLARTRLPCPPS